MLTNRSRRTTARAGSAARRSIQLKNADRQIRAIHAAMADKLLASPEMVPHVRDKIEQRYAAGQLRHGPYLTWLGILEVIDQPERFRQAILEDSPQMRKNRRRTPLVGILTETERLAALEHPVLSEDPRSNDEG